jgi:hypothetical protein
MYAVKKKNLSHSEVFKMKSVPAYITSIKNSFFSTPIQDLLDFATKMKNVLLCTVPVISFLPCRIRMNSVSLYNLL